MEVGARRPGFLEEDLGVAAEKVKRRHSEGARVCSVAVSAVSRVAVRTVTVGAIGAVAVRTVTVGAIGAVAIGAIRVTAGTDRFTGLSGRLSRDLVVAERPFWG